MTRTPAHHGDLDAILRLEKDLADRVAEARTEAERILREAQADVARLDAGLEEELARRIQELDARLLAEREQRLAEVAATARQRQAAWDAVDDATVRRAAGVVVDALVAGPRGARR